MVKRTSEGSISKKPLDNSQGFFFGLRFELLFYFSSTILRVRVKRSPLSKPVAMIR